MAHKLSPHAFRVWDNQERRYVEKDCETSETAQAFILAHQGWLATIQRKGGAKPADPERYTVERFTGLYDVNGTPVFEGDVLSVGGEFDQWIVRPLFLGAQMALHANAHETYLDRVMNGGKGPDPARIIGTRHQLKPGCFVLGLEETSSK